MKLIPVTTEKSTKLMKEGKYTFSVPLGLNKLQIKSLVQKVFGVEPIKVKTITIKGRTKRNPRGGMQKIKSVKKAIIYLKQGEKIEIFEEDKKSKRRGGKKRAKA